MSPVWRAPEASQGLNLELSNALARETKHLSNLIECPVGPIMETEAHAQDLAFATSQRLQNSDHLVPHVCSNHEVQRRCDLVILDTVAQRLHVIVFDGYVE